jgi:hypothetical protein
VGVSTALHGGVSSNRFRFRLSRLQGWPSYRARHSGAQDRMASAYAPSRHRQPAHQFDQACQKRRQRRPASGIAQTVAKLSRNTPSRSKPTDAKRQRPEAKPEPSADVTACPKPNRKPAAQR